MLTISFGSHICQLLSFCCYKDILSSWDEKIITLSCFMLKDNSDLKKSLNTLSEPCHSGESRLDETHKLCLETETEILILHRAQILRLPINLQFHRQGCREMKLIQGQRIITIIVKGRILQFRSSKPKHGWMSGSWIGISTLHLALTPYVTKLRSGTTSAWSASRLLLWWPPSPWSAYTSCI